MENKLVAGNVLENGCKLGFGGSVASSGFDMVDTEIEGAMNRGGEVSLIIGRNRQRWFFGPTVLEAHSSAGEQGHGQASTPEAAGGNHSPGKSSKA